MSRRASEVIQLREKPYERQRQPWNKNVPMQLIVAPWIKERLNLDCKTTEEYLEELRRETQ